jgi:ornithine cyclodeaminase/alanine dehydrogenase-like protein (mu-crystallin family)
MMFVVRLSAAEIYFHDKEDADKFCKRIDREFPEVTVEIEPVHSITEAAERARP